MFVDSNVDRDVTNVLFRLLSLCDDIITVGEVFSVVCLSVNFVLGLEITDEEIISVGGVLSVVEADIKVEDVKNIEVFIVVLGLEEVNETHVVRMFVDTKVDRDVTDVLFRLFNLCDDFITVVEVFSVVDDDIKVEDVENIEVFNVDLGLVEVNESLVVGILDDSKFARDVSDVLCRLLRLGDGLITVGEVFSVVC
jgi:hypothetical protein